MDEELEAALNKLIDARGRVANTSQAFAEQLAVDKAALNERIREFINLAASKAKPADSFTPSP